MKGGIYALRNDVTGQQYIGRSVKARARVTQHFSYLARGIHTNPHLQRSFDKYGRKAFSGGVLIICRRDDAPLYEYLAIKALRTDQREHGFNLTLAAERMGILTHAPEARAAIAEYNRTLKRKYERTPQIREKIAAGLRGKSGPNRGKKFSDQHRAKLAAAKVGTKHRLGKTFTDKSKSQISGRIKQLWGDPEYRKMMMAARGPDIGNRRWETRRRNLQLKGGG